MRKFFLLYTLILLFSHSNAQNNKSDFINKIEAAKDLYSTGLKYYDKKKYILADSLYTLSVNKYPNANTYYCLALTKLKLKDTCAFCHNLNKASVMGDTISTNYYNKICSNYSDILVNYYRISDAIYFNKIKNNPTLNSYFDLALTKSRLIDTCAFCKYLDSASGRGDVYEIWNYYKKVCCKKEVSEIIDSTLKNFKIFNIKYTTFCSNECKEQNYIKIDQHNDTIIYCSTKEIKNGYLVKVDEKSKDNFIKSILHVDTISKNSDKIFYNSKKINYKIMNVEKLPSFDGGEDAMYQWLGENIRYPQVAKEIGIMGTVIIKFIVEYDGSITNIKVIKDIGGGCGAEAVRVIKTMPKWKPAELNGVPVRIFFTLPIKFTLE